MSNVSKTLKEVGRYPTAIIGVLIIAGLVSLAVYTLINIPYGKAIELWRGDENTWAETPRNAAPIWLNAITRRNMPETIILSTKGSPEKQKETVEGISTVKVSLPFEFNYDDFPSEVVIFYTATQEGERPFVSAFWETPDGRKIALESIMLAPTQNVYLNLDKNLQQLFGEMSVETGLFADPQAPKPTPLKGQYRLTLEGYLFDQISDFDAKLIVYGKVHGWAGTDHRRRDMMVALLWGTPLALAFGLMAALGSTVTSFIIAAVGVWYGRWIDAALQRITEVSMILPGIPILVMVGTFYSRSIWVILSVVIIHNIFGSGIKAYRAMFLQVRNAPYIDAAKAYGASNMRLVFRYMLPRMVPVLIPSFVTTIPAYVFLEASLAVLGLGDPVLPTWGKLMMDANLNGALFKGYYYWVLQPASLLMVTGLGFAMVGFALDRIFNPKLRGR